MSARDLAAAHAATPLTTHTGHGSSDGAQFTPRWLADEVTGPCMDSLVYAPGRHQLNSIALWRLRPAEEVLDLKVADIAVGCGAFPVAACRSLAEHLVDAWALAGDTDAARCSNMRTCHPRDYQRDTDPLIVDARRRIAGSCLYGVDTNPVSVATARLALQLLTLHPGEPLLDLSAHFRVGDALYGAPTPGLPPMPSAADETAIAADYKPFLAALAELAPARISELQGLPRTQLQSLLFTEGECADDHRDRAPGGEQTVEEARCRGVVDIITGHGAVLAVDHHPTAEAAAKRLRAVRELTLYALATGLAVAALTTAGCVTYAGLTWSTT